MTAMKPQTAPEGETVRCIYCKQTIEPCLERKCGWKHKHPWIYRTCGGNAKPVTKGESVDG
jgi:hypothetical protein